MRRSSEGIELNSVLDFLWESVRVSIVVGVVCAFTASDAVVDGGLLSESESGQFPGVCSP